MALHSAPTPIEALRAIRGRRGVPERVLIDVTQALAPSLEGQALCQEVSASAERICMAAAAGSRRAVVNEAGRLGYLANNYAAEFRRMASAIEPKDAA